MSQKSAYYSAASTFLVKAGPGTVYDLLIGDPAAGGTVVIADLLNAGASPNLGIPSTFGPAVISVVKFPASPQPVSVSTFGKSFTDGLTVSIASTQGVHVYFD